MSDSSNIERNAQICADWWADRFLVAEKREAFRAAAKGKVLTILADAEYTRFIVKLESDYDPRDALLDAVREAGVECYGNSFSSDGILPRKTRMYFRADGSVETVDGYGGPFTILIPPQGVLGIDRA